MVLGSYKISEGLDDKLDGIAKLKFKMKREVIKMPISNKKILVSIGIDDFCDRVTYNYNQKNLKLVEEFNLYLKEKYDILLRKKWIPDSGRKVDFK